MTSKTSTQISGPTSENQRQIDPAGDRQPRATAAIRRGYDQFLILRNKSAVTRRKVLMPNANEKRAATPSYESLVFKTQAERSEGGFEPGRIFVVADQRVRDPQRVHVERAAERNARLPETGSTQILNRGQKSGGANQHFHAGNASNSCREIFRNRTRSPA